MVILLLDTYWLCCIPSWTICGRPFFHLMPTVEWLLISQARVREVLMDPNWMRKKKIMRKAESALQEIMDWRRLKKVQLVVKWRINPWFCSQKSRCPRLVFSCWVTNAHKHLCFPWVWIVSVGYLGLLMRASQTEVTLSASAAASPVVRGPLPGSLVVGRVHFLVAVWLTSLFSC